MKRSDIGTVVTFYSYKGGVGRSMALANVGTLAAMNGAKVLLLDWDLEAPGLEKYFSASKSSRLLKDPTTTPGIIDILERAKTKSIHWQDCIITTKIGSVSLDIISAGKKDEHYRKRVQTLNWPELFEKHDVAYKLDKLRDEFKEKYDLILIDSRTGITDIGDICTVLMPDALVAMFVSNLQNVEGTKTVIKRARESRDNLPLNRSRLIVLPLLGRDERTEYDASLKWKKVFAREFGDLFADWLPDEVAVDEAFAKLYIPYVPIWSFGENIPVLEHSLELKDPSSVSSAYSRVATLLESNFNWDAVFNRSDIGYARETKIELANTQKVLVDTRQKYKRRLIFGTMLATLATLLVTFTVGSFSFLLPKSDDPAKQNFPIANNLESVFPGDTVGLNLSNKSLIVTQSSGDICHHSIPTLDILYCVEPKDRSKGAEVSSWSPDFGTFASGNGNLIDASTINGDQLIAEEGQYLKGNVTKIKWNADSSQYAVATDAGSLYIISLPNNKEYRLDMDSEYFDYEWSADGESIYLLGYEKELLHWNFHRSSKPEWTQKELGVLGINNKFNIDTFSINKNSTALYYTTSSSVRQNQLFLSTLTDKFEAELFAKFQNAFSAAWSPTGNKIAIAKSELGGIDIIDIETTEVTQIQDIEIQAGDKITWSSTGKFLLILNQRDFPRLVELNSEPLNQYMLRYEGRGVIENAIFSPLDEEIITLSNTGVISKYDIKKLVVEKLE